MFLGGWWSWIRIQSVRPDDETDPSFGTLDLRLKGLYIRLKQAKASESKNIFAPDLRFFRGQFSKTIREFRELSKSDLCILLNSHPDILVLSERYPCFLSNYPFTEKFLSQFEDNTNQIMDYCQQGFLFGIGFPTEELTRLIAEICGANKNFKHFLNCWRSIN